MSAVDVLIHSKHYCQQHYATSMLVLFWNLSLTKIVAGVSVLFRFMLKKLAVNNNNHNTTLC